MASSIIGGLLEQGVPAANICASDPYTEGLQRLGESTGVRTTGDNSAAIAGADVVMLAVKPQVMSEVCAGIAEAIAAAQPVVVSIAAGITIGGLEKSLGAATALVRCMPNTPALLRAGATAMFANGNTSAVQRDSAGSVLGAVGQVHWVEREEQLDAVTALSGSGPAYFFLFMEAMAEAGERMGLSAELCRALTIQTGLGAGMMAAQGDVDLAELRRRVTSPGGTTEAALNNFGENDLRGIVDSAMQAALLRAQEMGREA